jgi:hypothetical protein
MDAKSFIGILKKPHRLANTGLTELIELGNQYPYTSIIHTLIAKKSEQESPEDFDSYLAKAAIYSLDRKKLHYIINSVAEVSSVDTIDETEETVVLETPQPEIAAPLSETIETNVTENNTINIADEIIPIEISADSLIQQIETAEAEKKDKKKKKEKKKHKEEEDAFTEITVDTRLSFLEWLKYINKYRKPPEKELETHYAAAQYEAEIIQEEPEEAEITAPLPSIWKKVSNEKAEVIISDLAERSIKKDESTITETFAKILELQKKYAQAIDAYEKLSLKYPEKNAFFALRIDELKKKI